MALLLILFAGAFLFAAVLTGAKREPVSSVERPGYGDGSESLLLEARRRANEMVQQAEAYKYNVSTVSSAEAGRFRSQLEAYRKMPEMFRLRTYLSFLENDCAPLRKYIVSASLPYQIIELNAEEKPRTDLTDTDLGDLK